MRASSQFKWLLFAILLTLSVTLWGAEHPVPLEKGADTDCAECHEAKTKGKAVHSAIKMGCGSCHEVKTEGQTTTVNLVQAKKDLCFACHEKETAGFLHGPYGSGRCILCHDPHTSEFPKQLRAAGNALCMACHGERRVSANTVKLFDSQEVTSAEFAAIPRLKLDDRQKGHPFYRHPVSARAKRTTQHDLSCLSCHQPHSSEVPHLAFLGKIQPEDVLNRRGAPISPCIDCHVTFDWESRQPQATVFFWNR